MFAAHRKPFDVGVALPPGQLLLGVDAGVLLDALYGGVTVHRAVKHGEHFLESGFRGVSWDKSRKKWRAYIKLKYKTRFLGRFNTFEEAVEARLAAEEKYYKPLIEKYKKEDEKNNE